VIRQLIVGESFPRNDVRTHLWTPSMKTASEDSPLPDRRDEVSLERCDFLP
jgi:hypothetical protein